MSLSQAAAGLDIGAVQAALKADGLDGWLLYDFRGLNPIAADVTAVGRQGGHLATRRWYYLIPATGEPRGLVHKIEKNSLAHLPGTTDRYAGRDQLEAGLRRLLTGIRRVAMEYSPGCAIPYVSRVDAGTIELVRQAGAEVVSSGDLVQRFSAVWDADAIASHRQASEPLHRVKDRAFDAVARRLRDGVATTEYDIQQLMAGWFRDEGLVSDADPNVSAAENSGNPHYLPTATVHRAIRSDEIVLLDLWGKLERPGAVFADITWMGYTGRRVPDRFTQAFAAVRGARDAGIALVQQAARAGPRAARLGSRPRGVVRAARGRVRRSDSAPHRPQPRRIGARQRRQHGRLRNARRPAAARRHRLHDRTGRVLRRLSAFGRKST